MISYVRRAVRALTRPFRRQGPKGPLRECLYADGKDYGPCDSGPVSEWRFVDGLGIPAPKSMNLCRYHAFRKSNGEM